MIATFLGTALQNLRRPPNSSFALIAFSFAQQAPGPNPPTLGLVAVAQRSAEEAADAGVTEAELQAYVNAKARADEIMAFWAESIARSRSAEVLERVRENEIGIAVGLEGLSLERYREIEEQVAKSAALREAAELLARE